MLRTIARWTFRVAAALFLVLCATNVLLPAIARAQFASQGGTVAQVLAALVGQPVTAERFVATASTGTAYVCNSALASCVDLGPGALNTIGTNGGGDVLLGDAAGNPTVRIGPSTVFTGNASWTNTNGAINCETNCIIRNNGGPLRLEDQVRYTPAALPTCDVTYEFSLAADVLSGGTATGARSNLCLCTSDGAASPAYAWVSLTNGGTVGTATVCP